MSNETKKITKMIDEITNFFLLKYKCEIIIHLIPREGEHEIKFLLKGVHPDDKEFNALQDLLDSERDPSLSSYYWQLAGEVEDGNELAVVAMMCDTIKPERSDDGLVVTLIRKIVPE